MQKTTADKEMGKMYSLENRPCKVNEFFYEIHHVR